MKEKSLTKRDHIYIYASNVDTRYFCEQNQSWGKKKKDTQTEIISNDPEAAILSKMQTATNHCFNMQYLHVIYNNEHK